MKRAFFSFFLAVLGGFVLSSCNFSLAADVTPPPGYQASSPVASTAESTSGPAFPVLPPDPVKGAATYVEKCAPCHGVGGMGDGPNAAALPNPVTALGAPEIAHTVSPADWFNIVTNGNLESFMPPFRSLSDRQRWDVVAYALMLSNPPAELSRGAALFQAECADCHGATGVGDGPQASSFVPDLTEQERMTVLSETDFFALITDGAGEKMPAFGDRLSEEDRWALSGYLRSLTFVSAPAAAVTQAAGLTPQAQSTVAAPSVEATSIAAAETPTSPEGATPDAPPSVGSVGGLVATGEGEPAAAGLEVNLHAFEQMDLVYTSTTTLRPGGAYLFDNLEMQPGVAYLTTIEYDGVIYGSDVAVAETAADQLELPIEVYATTSDTASLLVSRLHYFLEFIDEDTLRVLELFIISNTGDKTVVAAESGSPLIEFKLPPEAENLQFESGALGDRFVETANGFGDTLPIRPGHENYQVLFSYELPYNRNLELVRTTPLLTQAVIVLVPQEGIKVKADNLEDAGLREIQGVQYQMFNAPAMGRGDELRLTISGKPGSGGFKLASSSTTNLVIGLASLGVVLLIAGAWMFNRNRKLAESTLEDDTEESDDDAQLTGREAIMDAILALDDLYQEGKLPEEAYLQRRGMLKARLKDLIEP